MEAYLQHQKRPLESIPGVTRLVGRDQEQGVEDVLQLLLQDQPVEKKINVEDLLEVIFGKRTTRSDRLMNRNAIQQAGPGRWIVTGMTTLRRLARVLQMELPRTKNVTVAGVLLESLQRLPIPGDECRWGTLLFRVSEVHDRGQMIVELSQVDSEEGDSP